MDFEARRRGKSHPERRFETNTGRHADRYNEWVMKKRQVEDRKRPASAESTRSLFYKTLAQDQELPEDEKRKQRTRSAMARFKSDYEKLNLYVHGKTTREAVKQNRDQWHSGRRAALREGVRERFDEEDQLYMNATYRLACDAQDLSLIHI